MPACMRCGLPIDFAVVNGKSLPINPGTNEIHFELCNKTRGIVVESLQQLPFEQVSSPPLAKETIASLVANYKTAIHSGVTNVEAVRLAVWALAIDKIEKIINK